jgi:hypothetical protein
MTGIVAETCSAILQYHLKTIDSVAKALGRNPTFMQTDATIVKNGPGSGGLRSSVPGKLTEPTCPFLAMRLDRASRVMRLGIGKNMRAFVRNDVAQKRTRVLVQIDKIEPEFHLTDGFTRAVQLVEINGVITGHPDFDAELNPTGDPLKIPAARSQVTLDKPYYLVFKRVLVDGWKVPHTYSKREDLA